MKVVFRPGQFSASGNVERISFEGVFAGMGIDFLVIMTRLYEMPFIWFSEGLLIELDFESEGLILRAPEDNGGEIYVKEIVQEIPLNDLVSMSVAALRELYIRPFAADLAEHHFAMPKTAYAIRTYREQSVIEELAFDEGHPVLDDEITNLLYRKNWNLESSYSENSAVERA